MLKSLSFVSLTSGYIAFKSDANHCFPFILIIILLNPRCLASNHGLILLDSLLHFRVNFWGYSTINFFSPMIRYSSAGIQNCGRDGINEYKFLIKEAHKRGIEVIGITHDVILLVVYCFFFFFTFI